MTGWGWVAAGYTLAAAIWLAYIWWARLRGDD